MHHKSLKIQGDFLTGPSLFGTKRGKRLTNNSSGWLISIFSFSGGGSYKNHPVIVIERQNQTRVAGRSFIQQSPDLPADYSEFRRL